MGVAGGQLLAARELFRFYHSCDEETFALRGVSLTVHSGEMVAVVGPSGSGKSTLLACLAGLDDPDGGHVVVAGERITRRPPGARAKLRARGLGVLAQSGNLLPYLTVLANVRAAQRFAAGPHRPAPIDLLDRVGLRHRAGSWPSQLSGGEAARAGLAVALANDPPVLLADEPTGEVDGDNEIALLRLLRRHADADRAVVVATHSERVAHAADRVVRLLDGRLSHD
jgi:putative ABC transport system ATP-binding protein